MITIDPIKLHSKHFLEVWVKAVGNEALRYVCKGGRGSGKSTTVAAIIIEEMMVNPITALCVRKVARTLEESVYEELKDAIDRMGVTHLWKVYKSPLKLVYKPRGNSIIFRGADDPAKIKSIKISKFPLALLWVEEAAEFKTEDELTTIENSVLRKELTAGLKYKIFYTYNPPKRKQSWLNKKYDSNFVSDTTYVHKSTYLDNPFISQDFIREAEEVKKKNPLKYRWEYGGEAIGSGVVPFDNLTFRRIPDEEFKTFDNIRQGIDWGYGNDPFAFVQWHYDKTRRKIYAMSEIYGVKLSNRVVANKMKEKKFDREETTADSSEPKSVDELKYDHGIRRIKGAVKGPGSVEYGEKWLDDLEEIIIDPRRTPNIAKEFEDIDYQTDKDGNPKNRLEDKNNHAIDATRYAFERDMKSLSGGVSSSTAW